MTKVRANAAGTVQPAAPRAAATTSWNGILWNSRASRPAVTAQAASRMRRFFIRVEDLSRRGGTAHAVPLAPQIDQRRGRGRIVVLVREPEEDGIAHVRSDVGRGVVGQLIVGEEHIPRLGLQLTGW